jgi:uncharacterized protein
MTALQLLSYISAALVLQLVIGVGAGIWHRHVTADAMPLDSTTPIPVASSAAWSGWREFRVAARKFEDAAQTQCSFRLAPVDGATLPPFLPGQYLTFSLPVVGAAREAAVPDRTLTRCYSLSDRPEPSHYRITVKRVPSPPGRLDQPPGASSSHLHDRVQVGDVLRIKAPAGRFFIDANSDLPVVLVAGGIGVTPMMSMLRWCLAEQPRRTVNLYYGVRRGSEQAFKQTLESVAAAHPNFHLNVVQSDPAPDDVPGHDGQHVGRIDVDLLRRTLPHGRHQFYVCGPPAMMASLVPALGEWGVGAQDIHFESFGPASVPLLTVSKPLDGPPDVAAVVSVDVQFRRSGRTLTWSGQDGNLLDFAERQGIAVESGCRSGSCGSCEVRLVSGHVRYASPPDHEVASGCCLLCVGLPDSALVLEA